ncbi:hypothetical protein GIB67_041804 [Kingdonia uniflora]|uniref:Uncharacterized protein n=1 Tax=Kingdonia uniflora TaxID=39325 RepID=A0A7J7L5L5_9MAGN|nr:hypothetical protein GIB67_041804 [Kingdonia uniflora]
MSPLRLISHEELFYRIKGKIQPIPSSQCCIYKILECLRILSEGAYVPKIVSIGPFHRDKESIKAMEEHKNQIFTELNTPRVLLLVCSNGVSEDGVFKIPLFFFNETVSYLLGNPISLEQCDSDYASLISSYVVLLDALISTPKNVRLLRRVGIIDNVLRDGEEIVLIIKRLCKGFTVTKFYYPELCSKANAYYRTGWNKCRTDLKRDYINTLRPGTNRVAGHLANSYPGNCMYVEITPSSFTEHMREINVGDSSGTEYEILVALT